MRYLAHVDRVASEASAAAALLTARGDDATDADRDAADAGVELAARQLELARAYARYDELLHRAGFIDFGDQVAIALRLLRESPAAREALQRRYRYILVDEFQDTNRAQSELVTLLADRHRNITVVGDDDQSIYRFRGAAISNILGFGERYRRVREVVLRRNYRSRRPILEASHRLIRFNDPDRLEVRAGISKALRAERVADAAAAGPPRGLRDRERRGGLGRRARSATAIAAGARPRDHAVLVRTNAGADPVLRSLNMAGIPWRFSGTSGLYARPEVRLLLSFLRAVADPSSSVDVYALAASDLYGIAGDDLAAIVNSARRRNRSVWEVLEELERQPGHPPPLTRDPRVGDAARQRASAAHRARGGATRRPGDVPVPARQRLARTAREGRDRRPPRRRSRTSPACSRSSARSPRCSPTIGRSSWRATCRR